MKQRTGLGVGDVDAHALDVVAVAVVCSGAVTFRTGVLQGNFAVTPNPDKSDNEATGEPGNSTDMVLGAQRSRFGSNRFMLVE